MNNSPNDDNLLNLARQKFGQLSDADEKLFRAVAQHEKANFKPDTEELNQPKNWEQWEPQRILKADRLVWLLTAPEVATFLSFRGLRITGAKIEGILNLEFATISIPLIIEACVFIEMLNLEQCKLRALSLKDTLVLQGISAIEMEVEKSVLLSYGFRAEGEVNLLGVSIGGLIDCGGGKFINPDKIAIQANSAKITAHVFLRDGFRAEGEVNFVAASIRGLIDCIGGQFIYPDKIAIQADSAKIASSVFLRDGFRAEGEVNLLGVSIGGQLDCIGGQFINPEGTAIQANGASIAGSVFLGGKFTSNKFRAEGTLDFCNAIIRSELKLISTEEPDDLEKVMLNLRFAEVNTFSIESYEDTSKKNWAECIKSDKLLLNGFVYKTFIYGSPEKALDSNALLNWLRLQPKNRFSLQPYEQLAAVLNARGHQGEATDILINKENDRRMRSGLKGWEWFWNWFLGLTIDHGYHPQKALLYSMGMIVIGSFIFFSGKGLMTQTSDTPKSYALFNPFMYSVSTFTPIIDFQQKNIWIPDPSKGSKVSLLFFKANQGQLLLYYFWIQIAIGWVLTSLWVAGFTGLVQSKK
jgi:sRNA-binding regulator protein Hfq